MILVVVTALLYFSSFADGFPIVDCGSTGKLGSVTITGCDKSKNACTLRKGTNATIEIDFVTNENASDLKAVVHGTVLIVPVPFSIPKPDACTDPDSGVTCPLVKGTSYRYKATLPVSIDYPSVSVNVKWELRDQNGNDVVCIQLPARIR